MKPEEVKTEDRLLEIQRRGRGYIYNDTEWCLHRANCGILKGMRPEPTLPDYDLIAGERYPAGRNRGKTVYFDVPEERYEEVKAYLDGPMKRRGFWHCTRSECIGPGYALLNQNQTA